MENTNIMEIGLTLKVELLDFNNDKILIREYNIMSYTKKGVDKNYGT